MMEAIRIQNLRSLVDTGFVDIRPITVLVGQNNSGKSTFLRTFPLLRQSAEARTRGPILWYGPYVDFGSLSEAVHRKGEDKTISFHFKYALSGARIIGVGRRYRASLILGTEATVTLQVASGPKDEVYPAAIDVTLADQRIHLAFDSETRVKQFIVNTSDFSDAARNLISTSRGGLLPTLHPFEKIVSDTPDVLETRLFAEIRKHVHQNTHEKTIGAIAMSIPLTSSENMLQEMQTSPHGTEFWKRRTATWDTADDNFRHIRDLVIAVNMTVVLDICNEQIDAFARSVSYIAPVRATAERFARVQNLSVDEVDYQGANLTMFLRSLTEQEGRQFRDWTGTLFGFSTFARPSGGGHISLRIREEGSEDEINIADKGFGYSQVLPILTQLWLLAYRQGGSRISLRRTRGIPVVFAIEEPELHLHSKLQAKLMDAFVETVQSIPDARQDLRLILETHSETMINRLGHQIARGRIDPKDVSVVLFEKPGPDAPTSIRFGEFDQDGFLTNWPFGFFEPDRIS